VTPPPPPPPCAILLNNYSLLLVVYCCNCTVSGDKREGQWIVGRVGCRGAECAGGRRRCPRCRAAATYQHPPSPAPAPAITSPSTCHHQPQHLPSPLPSWPSCCALLVGWPAHRWLPSRAPARASARREGCLAAVTRSARCTTCTTGRSPVRGELRHTPLVRWSHALTHHGRTDAHADGRTPPPTKKQGIWQRRRQRMAQRVARLLQQPDHPHDVLLQQRRLKPQ